MAQPPVMPPATPPPAPDPLATYRAALERFSATPSPLPTANPYGTTPMGMASPTPTPMASAGPLPMAGTAYAVKAALAPSAASAAAPTAAVAPMSELLAAPGMAAAPGGAAPVMGAAGSAPVAPGLGTMAVAAPAVVALAALTANKWAPAVGNIATKLMGRKQMPSRVFNMADVLQSKMLPRQVKGMDAFSPGQKEAFIQKARDLGLLHMPGYTAPDGSQHGLGWDRLKFASQQVDLHDSNPIDYIKSQRTNSHTLADEAELMRTKVGYTDEYRDKINQLAAMLAPPKEK